MSLLFESSYYAFGFYVAVNALIMLILSILVVRARVSTQTNIGDGGNPSMAGPLRAHGNNTEYVPMALLLLWALCSPLGGSIWLVHGVGVPLTVGRILHAFGLSSNTGPSTLRLVGTMLTWIAFIVGIVGVLYLVFTGVVTPQRPISDRKEEQKDILDSLIRAARSAGAGAADALLVESVSSGVSYRLGKLEDVERSESSDLGLRVFVGNRVAFVSSTDFSADRLRELPERAVAMARLAPEDKYAGLASRGLLATEFPKLDLEDPVEPSTEVLIERARTVEGAAMAVKGVTNSEGGGASFGRSAVALATSEGFYGAYAGTTQNIGVAVLAGEGTGMERDYDYSSARYSSDLRKPEEVGKRAGEKAVARLNPRQVSSQKVPIVFDKDSASGLLGHFAGAISGASIARGVSFLKDKMGAEIFAPGIGIIDDPHRIRGLRSKPFDGEGVRNTKHSLIENGVLKCWLLDTASARQLGLTSNGHAARGTGGPPAPSTTNLYMAAGNISHDALISDIKQGLYVTELMGFGVNGVTGDYSRGAAGFWIENGKIAYPVSGVTIASNLKDMFRNLTPANDLEFRHGTNSPTVRVEGMTLAGA